jgi:hypothetical protein
MAPSKPLILAAAKQALTSGGSGSESTHSRLERGATRSGRPFADIRAFGMPSLNLPSVLCRSLLAQ